MSPDRSIPKIRPQYHVRKTSSGIDAWDVNRLLVLSRDFQTKKVDPTSFKELDLNHWYKEEHQVPTPSSIMEHIVLIQECDLSYPIILDANGKVMDGMHRICKALLQNIEEIDAVQFDVDPEPDYRNCNSKDLSYDLDI